MVPDPKHTPWKLLLGLWMDWLRAAGAGRMVGSEAQPDRAGIPWCSRLLVSAMAVYVYFWCTSDLAKGPVLGEKKSPQLVSYVAHAV